MSIYNPLSEEENLAIDRNLKGRELEKEGRTVEAVELYELNVAYEFEGDFPYERLRVIYGKQKRYDDVVRVLEIAVKVFRDKAHPGRADRLPKLARFEGELAKAKSKKALR